MGQLAQINVTMNSMQAQLNILSLAQQTQQGPRVSFTVGVAVAIILTGVKTVQPIKRYIRKMPNTRRDWAEENRGTNGG